MPQDQCECQSGGDWGSTITEHLARSHASSLVGIHLTDVPFWHIFQKPSDLTQDERKFLERNKRWQEEDGAYAMIQGTRPRTAAVNLKCGTYSAFYQWTNIVPFALEEP